MAAVVFVVAAIIVGLRTVETLWGIYAGIAAAVLAPVLWFPLVGNRDRSSTWRGAAVGGLIGVLAQTIPYTLMAIWYHGQNRDGGGFGNMGGTMLCIMSGAVGTAVGIVAGAVLGFRGNRAA